MALNVWGKAMKRRDFVKWVAASAAWPARALGGGAWLAMSAAFAPMLRHYRCSPLLAPLLPAVALFYTAATIGAAGRAASGFSWRATTSGSSPSSMPAGAAGSSSPRR